MSGWNPPPTRPLAAALPQEAGLVASWLPDGGGMNIPND